MTPSPLAAVEALHRALEAGAHGPALVPLFTSDATSTEHPSLVAPKGSTRALEAMIAASVAGAGLLAEQRYVVRSAVCVGSLAIVRLTWTGVVAKSVGPFTAGQRLVAHVAQFVETHEGRIASIETFDCYEPFAAA